jgi:hypothetical protein
MHHQFRRGSRAPLAGLLAGTAQADAPARRAPAPPLRAHSRSVAARLSPRRTAVVLAAFALTSGVAGPVAAADARMNPDPVPRLCAPGDDFSDPVRCQ